MLTVVISISFVMYIRSNAAVIKREDFLFSPSPVKESRKNF